MPSQAGDAAGPSDYPFVQMIGVGTPIDRCQEIDIGDKLKSVNGVFLKGKTRKEVHDMVKKIDIGSEIAFKVIKYGTARGVWRELRRSHRLLRGQVFQG